LVESYGRYGTKDE